MGFWYVVPVVLTSVIMIALAVANNVFLVFTKKRRYPLNGYRKLTCDLFQKGMLERDVPEAVLRILRNFVQTRAMAPTPPAQIPSVTSVPQTSIALEAGA